MNLHRARRKFTMPFFRARKLNRVHHAHHSVGYASLAGAYSVPESRARSTSALPLRHSSRSADHSPAFSLRRRSLDFCRLLRAAARELFTQYGGSKYVQSLSWAARKIYISGNIANAIEPSPMIWWCPIDSGAGEGGGRTERTQARPNDSLWW